MRETAIRTGAVPAVLDAVRGYVDRNRVVCSIFATQAMLGLVVLAAGRTWTDLNLVLTVLWLLTVFQSAILAGVVAVAAASILARSGTADFSEHLGRRILSIASDRVRIADAALSTILWGLFASFFTTFKAGIAVFAPFSWDRTLSRLDLALHLGHHPYELLAQPPILAWIVPMSSTSYALWMVAMYGFLFFSVAVRGRHPSHERFTIAYGLCWLLAGCGLAATFSSAGPVYFERLGLGSDYVPLFDALRAAGSPFGAFEATKQEILWRQYSERSSSFVGISAFPSMHVAMATLVALYCGSLSRMLGLAAWVWTILVFAGSVVFGWHYAADGYAGALAACASWWLAARLVPLQRRGSTASAATAKDA